MGTELAALVGYLVLAYAALGVGFGIWFAVRGATRLDPAAAGASVPTRLLLVPAAVLLWPLLTLRLWRRAAVTNTATTTGAH